MVGCILAAVLFLAGILYAFLRRKSTGRGLLSPGQDAPFSPSPSPRRRAQKHRDGPWGTAPADGLSCMSRPGRGGKRASAASAGLCLVPGCHGPDHLAQTGALPEGRPIGQDDLSQAGLGEDAAAPRQHTEKVLVVHGSQLLCHDRSLHITRRRSPYLFCSGPRYHNFLDM